MYDEETIDWDAVAPDNLDEELPSTSVDGKISFKDPEKGTGVVYLASIPPMFTPNKIRDAFSIFGEVGRVFLQPDKHKSKRRRFVEGWVEFKKKSVAKKIVSRLNNQQVGGKRRTQAFDALWCLKYLNGFKWSHLTEQLSFEKRTEEQRMRIELTQARKQAQHFVDQIQKKAKPT